MSRPSEPVEDRMWDAIVVGTGMGGATLGYALAKGGMKVLFLEKGRAHFSDPHARVGAPLVTDPLAPEDSQFVESLKRCGRFSERIEDVTPRVPQSFLPYIGSGSGGSTALYGMVLERFFPCDFAPRASFSGAGDSSIPDRWPVSYEEMAPFYEQAETLYRVRGSPDPLRGSAAARHALLPDPLRPANGAFFQTLQRRRYHPYPIAIACEKVGGCEGCEGYLCPKPCKNDSSRICLQPALQTHGAVLLSDCEVRGFETDEHSVNAVHCMAAGGSMRLRGRLVIMAAGALVSPHLLLGSKSATWPNGLANRSGQVGRNLMRHLIDLYLVKTAVADPLKGHLKEIGVNDFYEQGGEKLGTFQSFNHMPPAPFLINAALGRIRESSGRSVAQVFALFGGATARWLDRYLSNKLPFAGIMEDLPYSENRVLAPDSARPSRVRFQYRVSAEDGRRLGVFREKIRVLLDGQRFRVLRTAESNQALAHACGTLRFGNDASTSVLDPGNKAHDLRNLYVVDASFFPSSSGINPSLTIGANALRIAPQLLKAA